jgi:hypothetical protein
VLIDAAHTEAAEILTTHRAVLEQLAEALVERETLDTPELLEVFGGLPVWRTSYAPAGEPLDGAASSNGRGAASAVVASAEPPPPPRPRLTDAPPPP